MISWEIEILGAESARGKASSIVLIEEALSLGWMPRTVGISFGNWPALPYPR